MIIQNEGKSYFQTAVLIAILLHGVLVFFTFEKTYDAYVHIFFANHYVESWFDHWEYRWYTGFTMTSYPPLIHQVIALFSLFITLKGGFVITAVISAAVFARGVFVFSKLWVDERSAGIASILGIISTSYVEALHIFGQLPSVTGIGILLNATPFIYQWIRGKKIIHLVVSLGFLSVITTVHHVTTIFGLVFFIFPVIGLAILDNSIVENGNSKEVRLLDFWRHLLKVFKPAIFLGIGVIFVTLLAIFPYWVWSTSDPITQVPIPHGSRDSFIEVFSSGLVFFLIPWGMMLFFLPHLFRRVFTKRTIILALSLSGAFLLGTGGTTPLPEMILGETAFNILTLDRFTYWASIMSLPFFGYYISSLLGGNFKQNLIERYGYWSYRITAGFYLSGLILTCIFVINIHYFQPLQPAKIDIQPIVNFLERDQHDDWRYLTLGFGDQVAWLGANTKALTVDGNYHSARRLPEMTTRKVERLENAKYLGTQGIAALHQFLTVPEKYHLKYIFSNDQFYNPILYFSGWEKLRSLENNIDIWMKPDIAPLPSILPRKDIPRYQQLMWSLLPLSLLVLLIILLIIYFHKTRPTLKPQIQKEKKESLFFAIDFWWIWLLLILILSITVRSYIVNKDQHSPENLMTAYFDALDFKYFEKAFAFYEPSSAPTIEQMLTDLSREDDITASYAKLNDLEFQTKYFEKNKANIKVKADWITSISTYTTFHDFNLELIDSKWWIKFKERDFSSPPEQIFATPEISFLNQGRRNIKTDYTAQSDILDRPDLFIKESNLIKNGDQYHIVGKVINLDNDPAYINISASLFDENNKEIISYNTREVIIHRLLPKEETYFRIDFEDVANQITKVDFPKVFDPSFLNPYQFLQEPKTFVVNAQSVVSTVPLYKNFAISDLSVLNQDISGVFINTGTKEINIPQLIIAYYENNKLLWVGNEFLKTGIRAQRSKTFRFQEANLDAIDISMSASSENLLVNSKKSDQYSQKWLKNDQNTNNDYLPYRKTYLVDVIPSGYVSQK